jgi:hypothetical protein
VADSCYFTLVRLAGCRSQLRHFQLGTADPPDAQLLDKSALRAALPTVSKVRYEQTLCAEHPSFKPFLGKLEREKAEQDPDSLSSLWGVSKEQTMELCEKLIEAGFFERRGTKSEPIYWVPFLYRDGLDLVQGSAAKKAKKAVSKA